MLSDDPMSCKCTSSRCSIRASKCERDAVFERWFPMVTGSFMAKVSYTRPRRLSFLPVIRVRGCILYIDSLQPRYTATHQNLWTFLSEPWHFMSCHFENLVPYGLNIPLLIFLIKWRHPGGASHFLLSAAPRVKIKREIAYKMVCFAITGLGRSLLGTVIL